MPSTREPIQLLEPSDLLEPLDLRDDHVNSVYALAYPEYGVTPRSASAPTSAFAMGPCRAWISWPRRHHLKSVRQHLPDVQGPDRLPKVRPGLSLALTTLMLAEPMNAPIRLTGEQLGAIMAQAKQLPRGARDAPALTGLGGLRG
jgi:hypothetical protein